MSEIQTPETDAMVELSFHRINFPTAPVPAEFARKLERERDEWRKAAFEITEQATKSRKELERERDEAVADRANGDIATMTINHYERILRERDEAIPAGEWVPHEDYKKIHDAASHLLVAINKKLPIGCFTMVSSEYYRLQNAVRGKEDAK